MTKLKTLHLYGSPIFLYNLVSNIPLLAPNLEGITLMSVSTISCASYVRYSVYSPADIIHMGVEYIFPGYHLL